MPLSKADRKKEISKLIPATGYVGNPNDYRELSAFLFPNPMNRVKDGVVTFHPVAGYSNYDDAEADPNVEIEDWMLYKLAGTQNKLDDFVVGDIEFGVTK